MSPLTTVFAFLAGASALVAQLGGNQLIHLHLIALFPSKCFLSPGFHIAMHRIVSLL